MKCQEIAACLKCLLYKRLYKNKKAVTDKEKVLEKFKLVEGHGILNI